MTSELIKNRDLLHLVHNANRTGKKSPSAFTVDFHFVRHGERQSFYPGDDGVLWSIENIMSKERCYDDGLTGFGREMAKRAGLRILNSIDRKKIGKIGTYILFVGSQPDSQTFFRLQNSLTFKNVRKKDNF